ncbi:1,2-phenylacetyl-CoA epoxidase subunit PaaE [Brevibacterium sandarakinum]|uniref:1,2-phenylacetyl-CoA epoxidase subunit PaaE n=1 Tax=Brevibacterium sandarakinum TaxID=629680 RepID=UPI00264C518E|nr:1,2-phenylacetyl-CoA epoxidase subunit PaaE [Brevibacterium sandarakinum]MDN5657144.1 phenylacetate-CoA oxygenase/reductase subunit PaaK [Brevibacterium sandarakinum]
MTETINQSAEATPTTQPNAAAQPNAATQSSDVGSRTAFYPLMVKSVDHLTDDSAAVTFDVPAEYADLFDFAAGQSLTLRRMIDGAEHRRSYSICAPAGTDPRIGVREIPEGLFSQWLVNDVRPGETIEVQPPSGSFQADPDLGGRHLCIAAGSGITPMLSIATTVLSNPDASVTMLYGNRNTNTVMFTEELADLKDSRNQQLDLIHILSREPREVDLFSGRLDEEKLRQLLTSLVPIGDMDHVWLCGPFGMLSDARKVLAEFGVPKDKIHFELFYVDEPPPEVVHADKVVEGATSDVTIVLDGRRSTSAMSQGKTILDSAQESRSDLPFACKGGVCGTCRAKICDGEVDMVRNYALEDSEVEANFVLTCQTFPVSDEVTVDYDS